MRDFKFFARHVTRHPNLDRDGHRSPADFLHVRITPDGVPYSYRLQERHSFHRRRDYARLRRLRGENPAAEVHLRGHPPPKNVAIRIRILRHGDGLNHQLALGSVAHYSVLTTNGHE